MTGLKNKGSTRTAYIMGIAGVVATLLMAASVVYYWDWVQRLEGYGYVGAFIISILGGATIIVPVPMLAIVFALGGVLKYTWLLGIVAGLGETFGALTIYMTGYGGGAALYRSRHGRIQAAYLRLMGLMERRGSLTLFILASVLNPFFYPAALAAGALRFGVKKYFLICWAGKTIKGFTVAYAGYWGLRGLLRMLGAPI
ncbi:MAG: VTT domain-containing protein [Chloroflexi bacterium]|jgi:membrane protein YqaA with SNARE-associated domain|nr:VTT domain-containing protein [Chloroflexota bacterium]